MNFRFFLLTIFISFTTNSAFSQKIYGHLTPSEHWIDSVYLEEVNNYYTPFNGDINPIFIEPIDKDGNFSFQHLMPMTLYRMSIQPKKGSKGVIQKGFDDNYAFIVTDSTNGIIYFKAEMDSLFLSYNAYSEKAPLNKLQQEINQIRIRNKPLNNKLRQAGIEFQQAAHWDSAQLIALKLRLVNDIKWVADTTNAQIIRYLDSINNPLVISLGLAFAGFGHNSSIELLTTAQKLLKGYSEIPLAQSILQKASYLLKPVDTVFLSKIFTLINGQHIQLDTINTRIVVLDFWASWCLPCRKAIRESIEPLHEKYPDEIITIIGVITGDKRKSAQTAIKKDKNPFTQIYDSQNYLRTLFQIESIPSYVLINCKTKEIRRIYSDAEVIENAVKSLTEIKEKQPD